jgi:hypothetical protein
VGIRRPALGDLLSADGEGERERRRSQLPWVLEENLGYPFYDLIVMADEKVGG